MNFDKNGFKEVFTPWILNIFPPTSLVYSSPNAQKILGKNFLSPSQFMRPFGDLTGTSLIFLFNEKYQNFVSDFKMDFYDTQDFCKIENNQINNYIINCLSSETVMPTFENNFIKLNKKEIQNFLSQLIHYSPKYYLEFEKLFFELCKFQETELYQQPLLYIYICDIKEDVNIISYIKSQSMPKLISSGAYEQITFDLLILLNDKSDRNNQNLNKLVLETNFKNKYIDKEVIAIDINSGCLKENQNDLCDDIWSKYIHKIEEYSDGFDPIERGKYITKTEINIFRQKFTYYIKNKFRPKLLELMQKLDKNLQKNSGINILFNKLKPAKIEKQEYIMEYNLPKLLSTDRQRYLLSILLFHARDYLDAYENLKKLRDSIKGKNKEYENSVKQLLVICRYMKKEEKLKVDTLAPFQNYIDNKQYLLAYRNVMLYLKMTEQLKVKYIVGNIYKYNYYLMNHSIKYFSALLYEKIGFYFFISRKPKPRKFALNILNYSTQQYLLEKESDIKNFYLIQNFGYILDLFKIDYDYSLYDNYDNINTFYYIKKYIYKSLISACEITNNTKLGIPIFSNYLKFLLNDLNNKKNSIFDLKKEDESEEINFYFQKLNSIIIKGKINYLEDFPIPIIDDDSLVYYIEQDQKILKYYNQYKLNFVNNFRKYTELSIEQRYSVLSEDDISSLRYLDEQISRNFISNYFMKRNINVKVGEQIFIKINIYNPLDINLPIKNLTLIINKISNDSLTSNPVNNNDYNCSFYNRDIPSKQTFPVGIKIIFNSPGDYEITGLIMTLFKNINVKYLFNKKRINPLYLYSKKHINDNNLIKKNFRFHAIDSIKTINVVINNNNEKIDVFQNQIFLLPIKIVNNNNDIEIKKYTVFLETNDDIIIYPKYLLKNYLDSNNTILIPIIGQKVGECRLKIIIKYEEKIKSSNLDIYRNVISIKVHKGININIEDTIYEYSEINNKRKIKLNMDIINHMNYHSISFSHTKSINFNKGKFVIEEFNNQLLNNTDEFQDKNINKSFIIKLLNEEKKENYSYDNLFENIIENNDLENYELIIEFLKNVYCGENNLIIKYKLNILENNKIISLNCIFKHEIKIDDISFNQMLYIDKDYLKNILIKCFDINYEIDEVIDEEKYININIKMINNMEYFHNLKQMIEYIEIKVNNNDNNFEWIGIYSTVFKDLDLLEENKEYIKTFNCLINNGSYSLSDNKEKINLNQFDFYVKIKNSDNIFHFNDFPYNVYYSFN